MFKSIYHRHMVGLSFASFSTKDFVSGNHMIHTQKEHAQQIPYKSTDIAIIIYMFACKATAVTKKKQASTHGRAISARLNI